MARLRRYRAPRSRRLIFALAALLALSAALVVLAGFGLQISADETDRIVADLEFFRNYEIIRELPFLKDYDAAATPAKGDGYRTAVSTGTGARS